MASKKLNLYYVETKVSYLMKYVVEATDEKEATKIVKSGNVEEYDQDFIGEKVDAKSIRKMTKAQFNKFQMNTYNGRVEPSDLVRTKKNNNLLSKADKDFADDKWA